MDVAVNGMSFAVAQDFLVETEFGSEIVVEKLAARTSLGDGFEAAEKSRVRGAHAVNFHRQRIRLKLLGADDPRRKIAPVQ